mmetsp:Transcript_11252/g.33787  ORF Transcript_11252/g.33787 Transcript_11252/m.33787 type:complete len:174 (-) Transcript_11252:33-554(-)
MPAKPRVAAEAGLDALTAELVRYYRAVGHGTVPAALLEAIGQRVGRALAERYTRDKPRMVEHLDVIKWTCKELWGEVFRKQVDSLRTNHRGTFVLKDNHFRWTRSISVDPGDLGAGAAATAATAAAAADHLHLPCAIIRGALQSLGVDCAVTADPSHLPAVDFTVVIAPPPTR